MGRSTRGKTPLDRPLMLTRRQGRGERDDAGRYTDAQPVSMRTFGRLERIDDRYDPQHGGGRTAGDIRIVTRYDPAWIAAAADNLEGWTAVIDGTIYEVFGLREMGIPRKRYMVVFARRVT